MKKVGKTSSIISKLIGGMFVLVTYIITQVIKWKATEELLTSDEVSAIIEIGFYLFLLYMPVDVSIIAKNVGTYIRKVENKETDKDNESDTEKAVDAIPYENIYDEEEK